MPTPVRKTLAAEASEPVKLKRFEGREVLATQMTLRNTSDGLSDAMATDPMVLHHGDEVYVVCKGVVVDIQHPGVKDTEGVARKHIIRVVEGTVVDPELVEEHIAGQRARNLEHAARLAGQDPLDGMSVSEAE